MTNYKSEPSLTVGLLPGDLVDSKSRRARQQLPQNIRQNSAVQVVIDLNRCVDSQDEGNLIWSAVGAMDCERHVLAWFHLNVF